MLRVVAVHAAKKNNHGTENWYEISRKRLVSVTCGTDLGGKLPAFKFLAPMGSL